MEQHPVPQQISSYQFRLVGDMTLKQFFQIGGGALISLLIYASGLHPVAKWPLIIFSFALGAALAFLPYQDRPLSFWIVSFFRTVYSPTEFYWKRTEKEEVFFKEVAPVALKKDYIAPKGEVELNKYLKIRPDQKETFLTKLEDAEKSFLSTISQLFTIKAPHLSAATISKQDTEIAAEEKVTKPKEFKIPTNKPVSIATKGFRPRVVIEERPLQETIKTPASKAIKVDPTLKGTQLKGFAAQFSQQAAPPLPPTIPNTIVGQVVNTSGKTIDGAILEVRDLAGRPVRALRSNKVGHFMIVTSLQEGQYTLTTEKDGYHFEPVSFETKGEIIPPIAIRGKSVEQNPDVKITNLKIKQVTSAPIH